MSKSTQAMAAAFLGIAALFGSFALASNDFAYGSQSALAAAIGLFDWNSSISISRNTNSPSGSIIPGRSQVLAVFDVKGKNLSGGAHITQLPVEVAAFVGDSRLAMDNFVLVYKYCVPKGNIYAYGYKYGYSGVFCSGVTASPSSITKTEGIPVFGLGKGYKVTFSGIDLPVYADQTSAVITILGNAYYPADNGKSIAKVRASIPDATAQVTSCKTIHYGFKNRYGYVKCTPARMTTATWLAVGNVLSVSRSYGYYTTGKPTDPSRPPIIEPPTTVPPQTAPATDGSTSGNGTTGTQTGTAGTNSGTTDTPPPKPKPLPVKTTSPRESTQFEIQTP